MPLTLEERERRAYIANSPDHPLLINALEGDEEHDDEVTKLEGEIEDKDTEIADLELKVEALETRIHESGVDLV